MGFEIRKSRQRDATHRWVIDDLSGWGDSYIDESGELGLYFDYATKVEAQVAFDLYLEKQKFPQEPIVKKQYGHPRFYEILEQMKELHSQKNHDYAGTSDSLKNLRACERLDLRPFMGVMVRLQDKFSRLEQFTISQQLKVKDESVTDTLMDVAVYSVLAIILLEEENDKKGE